MFNKYAIEPELVVAWCKNALLHGLYKDSFGLAAGRLVGQVPAKWERKVYDVCPEDPPLLKPKVFEFLRGLKEALFGAGVQYDATKAWVDNAMAAHAASPLTAILATAPHPTDPLVMDACNNTVPAGAWAVPNNLPINRQAAAFATALQPALSRASELIFVDPMLQPDKPRYRNFLLALLRATIGGRNAASLTRVEYVCRPKPEWTTFDADCSAHLPAAVPTGVTLCIVKIDGVAGGQWIHDRFILTNKVGWSVPSGLDEAPAGATTIVSTLSGQSYVRSWADYGVTPRPFRESPPILIRGTA